MDFGIKLDKNAYNASETAKGTLLTRSDNSLKVRKLKFSVCGKERYEESMVGQWGGSPSEKYDIFFFEDLYPLLKSTNAFPHIDDKIEIPQGSFAIPFHFSIPDDAIESYRGKNVRIVYEVEIHADMGRWKKDYRHILSFEVLNPNMTYMFGDRPYLGKEQEKKEGEPYLGLELEMTNGLSDMLKFSPGQIIKGILKIENTDLKRVKKAIIQLLGIEYPKCGRTRIISEIIKKEIKDDESKNKETIAFEIQIPQNAKRSYNAKHSEYYWLLDTQVDISGSPNIHAKRIIQVA